MPKLYASLLDDLDPSGIDTSALIRELSTYSSGDDETLIAALPRLLEHPGIYTTRGLSDALGRLTKQGNARLTEAAVASLTKLWTELLDPLSDSERRRAARMVVSLDHVSSRHRMVWAIASKDLKACVHVCDALSESDWSDHVKDMFVASDDQTRSDVFTELLTRPPESTRVHILEMLDAQTGPNVLLPLTSTLEDASSPYLTALAQALERMGRAEAEPILQAILTRHSKEEQEDLAALNALSTTGTTSSLALLGELMTYVPPSAPLHSAFSRAIEGIMTRASTHEAAGGLSVSGHTKEGALSIQEDASAGSLSLVTHLRLAVSNTSPTPQGVAPRTCKPQKPIGFWGTWSLFNHPSFAFLFLFFFLALPIANAAGFGGRNARTPDVADVRAGAWALFFVVTFVVNHALVLVHTAYRYTVWKRRGWLGLLKTGWLTHTNISVGPLPRVQRRGDAEGFHIEWVDEHGEYHSSTRSFQNTFHTSDHVQGTREGPQWALTAGGHALVLGIDTPFHLDDDDALRLNTPQRIGLVVMSMIYAGYLAFGYFLVSNYSPL